MPTSGSRSVETGMPRQMGFKTRALLACYAVIAMLLFGCASAPGPDSSFKFYNAYRVGNEALPTAIDGCESLGTVNASIPEPPGTSVGFYDPKSLLETLRAKATRKGADTGVVLLPPKHLQRDSRSLRASVFKCGTAKLPEELGPPIR
jgi:hypothetical protein